LVCQNPQHHPNQENARETNKQSSHVRDESLISFPTRSSIPPSNGNGRGETNQAERRSSSRERRTCVVGDGEGRGGEQHDQPRRGHGRPGRARAGRRGRGRHHTAVGPCRRDGRRRHRGQISNTGHLEAASEARIISRRSRRKLAARESARCEPKPTAAARRPPPRRRDTGWPPRAELPHGRGPPPPRVPKPQDEGVRASPESGRGASRATTPTTRVHTDGRRRL
jgi:hypothetical protein